MAIQFIVILNRQGRLRLAKWYTAIGESQQRQTIKTIHKLISSRDHRKQSNFVLFENLRLVYKRYNGLFFVLCISLEDNELGYLEVIPLFVEILDSYFDGVCELDIVFNFYKVYRILDEIVVGGELQDTNKTTILNRIYAWDKFA
ncbi:hypothetical protein HII12_004017 [Brettanomyces bruxellensis]|uniref:AP complex subunit sigma n=1 Tax=Dekkera bruxellensis TaxID=5007 RepID=A0A8H6BCF7_DEKBR|nr:hypothetical protein HII12_004017 [Brettanomyces bruxellensis]